jgi:hypothetical protein
MIPNICREYKKDAKYETRREREREKQQTWRANRREEHPLSFAG